MKKLLPSDKRYSQKRMENKGDDLLPFEKSKRDN